VRQTIAAKEEAMFGELVRDYLNRSGVVFETMEHPRVVGAQSVAQVEHESGWRVAKPVMLKLGNRLAMAVIPAPARVDLRKVRLGLMRDDVELATEAEYASTFPDCELGAEPPFGALYGLPMIVDRALLGDPYLVFRDGTHRRTLKTALSDYLRLVDAIQLDIGVLPPVVRSGARLRERDDEVL
jgi:Ala-tRNA(Pro) deacylase